jgi:predicted porin
MKKSLIALAVAGAFAAPAAMADVTISGAIAVGPAYINSGSASASGGGGGSVTRTSVASNYSNINISSTDDIGNGNKVIFNYQMQTNVSGFDTPVNRNSYLGLTGSWGTFKAGNNENVYERFMYESDPLDGAVGMGGSIQMLGHSGLQGPAWFAVGNQKGDQFWRRTEQTIWYTSPNINGFTFEVDQTLTAFKAPSPGLNPTITSIGGQFKPADMPYFVNLSYEKHKDVINTPGNPLSGGANPEANAWQLGGGYTFQDLTVYARYESIQYKTSTDKLEVKHYWFAAKYALPTGYVGAEFGMAPKAKLDGADQDQTTANMISAGYFHNLSKQSQLQFIATRISNDNNIDYGIGAGAGSVDGAGRKIMGIYAGIKHTF